MAGSDLEPLAFDRVSALAPALLILVTCLTVFHRLKVRWPIMVNCWFCNENSKIWRQHLNWWLCPWCEQHNGFSKNGDYTYDIPEQYATPNMSTRYCKLVEQNDSCNISKSHLCVNCNKQESLKLLELSNFEPKNERNYNTELKGFKEYLEKRYPLCNNCKLTVQNVLSKQALWLTRYKMLFFRQKPIRMLIGNFQKRKSEAIFRIISTILIPIILYNHDSVWLPIGGLFFHLCAWWTNSTKRKRIDVLLIFLWFCIIIFVYIKNSTFQNVWLTTECIVQHRIIEACAFIIGFLNIKPISYKNTLIGSVALKKLKLRSRAVIAPQTTLDNYNENYVFNGTINAIESSVYKTGEVSSTEIKSHSTILRQKLSTITLADNSNENYLNSASQNRNSSLHGDCLNHSLSTLFLSEDSSRCGKNTVKAAPAIFERKVYSATSSENLFKKSGSNRRYVLSPPKLRSMTQTSWVAGGYWQESHMMTATPPTLSRSSSQSSGFGSAGSSNFAPSREPSVHEFDRCSVVSDATRWSYHTPRANHHSLQSSRADEQESYVREANVGSRSDLTPAFPGHSATIVANSGWLSTLLCGSLILNMIVLCATLLR
ncbi:uncharacterized protein LOC126856789 [Cataglyphis hispanica]|uniref:uncharacterized protein LOC126856789 n=1 Tax=Cataglyphis hispanica TaxID=1086592 RepID=UPI0021808221|nr:uncharacterized protein LOC126856789 [Cataglyphis hispanica]